MAEFFRQKAFDEARGNGDSTKARILKAAEDLFANQGYKGTTTKEISDEAGVNIALIHYHWGTKAELWNAVHASVREQSFELAKQLMEKYPRVETFEDLCGFVRVLFDYHIEHPNLAKIWVMPGIVGGSRVI